MILYVKLGYIVELYQHRRADLDHAEDKPVVGVVTTGETVSQGEVECHGRVLRVGMFLLVLF
jgi:hypothetical protein